MEVDWEEIDRQAGNYPIKPAGNFGHSSLLTDNLTTVVDNGYEGYSQSPTYNKPDLESQRPNAVGKDTMYPTHFMKVQKPDGGF